MQKFRHLLVSLEEILVRLRRGEYSVAKEVFDDISDLPLKCEKLQRKAAIELEVSHPRYIPSRRPFEHIPITINDKVSLDTNMSLSP
jgi:hypothetical protein